MKDTETTTKNTYGILYWDSTADKWAAVDNRIRFDSLEAAVKRAKADLGKTAQSRYSGEFINGEYVMPEYTVEGVRAYNPYKQDDYEVVWSV